MSLNQVNANESRFWQLLEREHRAARAYCCRLVGNTDDGDDLYQDAIIRAHAGFETLKNIDSFRPWLYQILNNAFKNRVRSPWWKRVLSSPSEFEVPSFSSNPAGAYDARRRLEFAFSAISPEDRILVTLSEIEGWKISELAQLLDKSEGFIKMRLSRARRKMRNKLETLYKKSSGLAYDKGVDALCCATKQEED